MKNKLYNGIDVADWNKLSAKYRKTCKLLQKSPGDLDLQQDKARLYTQLYGGAEEESWQNDNKKLQQSEGELKRIIKDLEKAKGALVGLGKNLAKETELKEKLANTTKEITMLYTEIFNEDGAIQLNELNQRITAVSQSIVEKTEEKTAVETQYDKYSKPESQKIECKMLEESIQKSEEQIAALQQQVSKIQDVSKRVGLVCFPNLQLYQLNYEHRNLNVILNSFIAQLQSVNDSVSSMVIIANFMGWYKEGCSEGLRTKMNNLFLPASQSFEKGDTPKIIIILNSLRNVFMHILDDLDYNPNIITLMGNPEWQKSVLAVKTRISELIIFIIKSDSYLINQGERTSLPDRYSGIIPIEQNCELLLHSFPSLSPKRNLSGDVIPLDSIVQMRRFKSSVIIGTVILRLIHEELAVDLSLGFSPRQIIASFKCGQLSFPLGQETGIYIKYDALLQALGESLGNLRQYKDLKDIGKFDIAYTKDFELIDAFVLRAKEYRNARTHCGYYDFGRLNRLLDDISNSCSEITEGLNMLSLKVREKYSEKQMGDSFDKACINAQHFVDPSNMPAGCTFQ